MEPIVTPASAPPLSVASHPAWDLLVKVIAPITLFISGACYLTGFLYKSLMLSALGLGSGLISPTLQDTIASGYVALWNEVSVDWRSILLAAVAILIALYVWQIPAANKFVKFIDLVFGSLHVLTILFVVAVYGFAAGTHAFERDLAKINSAISSNCTTGCLNYFVKGGSFWGFPIASDKERLYIASRSGLRIVSITDLRRVARRRGRPYARPAVITLM